MKIDLDTVPRSLNPVRSVSWDAMNPSLGASQRHPCRWDPWHRLTGLNGLLFYCLTFNSEPKGFITPKATPY